MRPHILLSLMAFFVFSACDHITDNETKPTAKAQANSKDKKTGDKSKDKKLPKVADKIKGFTATEGLFTIYVKGNECYWLLTDEDLKKQFLLICNNTNGIGTGLLAGNMGYLRLVTFEKSFKKKILMRQKQTYFTARPGRPEGRSLNDNFNSPILAEFPVIARDFGRSLINVSKLFTEHKFYSTHMIEKAVQLKSAKNNGRLLRAGCYPENIEFDFSRDFFGDSKFLDNLAHPDNHKMTIRFHLSISELKKSDFRPRHEDYRVGYFRTLNKDISVPFALDPMNRYINRWDLRKKHPEKEKSEVVKPVTYWISNNTPHEIRHILRDAVLEWNIAFEKIGLLNAIDCKFQPVDAEWSLEDFRYNVIQWITSDDPSFAGMGPSKTNPLTGEILRTQIRIDGEVFHGRDQFAAHINPDSCQVAAGAPEAMMWQNLLLTVNSKSKKKTVFEQYIRKVMIHEVGHTLGLRHNFKSSTSIPFSKIHDKSYTSKHGLTGSIMDYVRANIHPDPEKQGHYYSPTIGAYDIWAIAYGYAPTTSLNEKEVLDGILKNREVYGTDRDIAQDPLVRYYDYSDDPIAYDALRRGALDKVLKNLSHDSNLSSNDGSRLRRYFERLITSFYHGASMHQGYISGQIYNRAVGKGEKPPLSWVDTKTEERAAHQLLAFLNNSKRINKWQKKLNLLPPLRVGTWHEESTAHLLDFNGHIRELHQEVVSLALSPRLLNRLLEHQHRGLEKGQLSQNSWLKKVDAAILKNNKDYWGRMNVDIYVKTLLAVSKSTSLNAEGRYLVESRLKSLLKKFSDAWFLGKTDEAEATRQSLSHRLNKYFEIKK
jgi:hypothetical protein